MASTWPRSSRSRLLHSPDEIYVRNALTEEYDHDQAPEAVAEPFKHIVSPQANTKRYVVRTLALLCACSLSIGSHYATYILGPLKTQLSREMGTSNTEFSLIIAALSLNSTWTPLLGGFLAGRFGTTFTSIIATGLIFLGQIILLLGDIIESVRLMTFGMFVFGLGVSPLAVVQESIIVRFFKDHGLGLSMALGLVAGKASSFISARTSFPLSERYGPRAPFIMATLLTCLSFAMNLVYLSASKWLVKGSGTELEASELRDEARARQIESVSEAEALKQVAEKKKVHLRDITRLGDVFWAYIGINVLCGALWTPFTHLAPNIIEKRYGLTEREASNKASLLLAGSVFLYPLVGVIIDRLKKGPTLHLLFVASSTLTLLCYFWLWLPPSITHTPVPAIATFCVGQGFAPLLLVVIVPTLVASKYVPTTLGAHKSLEQTGSTIFQTFAGLYLDKLKKHGDAPAEHEPDAQAEAIQRLLRLFIFLNVCQLLAIVGLWALDRRRKRQALRAAMVSSRSVTTEPLTYTVDGEDFEREGAESPKTRRNRLSFSRMTRTSESLSMWPREGSSTDATGLNAMATDTDHLEEARPLLNDEAAHDISSARNAVMPEPEVEVGTARTKAELRRGEFFGAIAISAILFAWIFFMWTAVHRLRSKEDRKES